MYIPWWGQVRAGRMLGEFLLQKKEVAITIRVVKSNFIMVAHAEGESA